MTKRRSHLFLALLAGASVCSAPGTAFARQSERYAFDLPAQDLGDALRAVAARAGWELYAPADEVNGVSVPRLRGNFTAKEAIEKLLRGTSLVARFDDGAVIIKRKSRPRAAASQPEAEAIVVTGTRIRGVPPAAPLTVVTNEDVRNAAQADLGEVARSLPQNFGGGQNPGIGASQGSGTENVNLNGASTFNLRGIGPNATLTLLNGNRFSHSGINSVLDISAIPVAAVERVEIVTDGASAIYGADAVAGVVNILLRKDYEGVSTSARLGASTDGGNFQQQYNVLGGATWSDGGFLATYDYFRNGAIYARDRSYTATTNPDTTLYPALRRHSLLLSGHQQLGDSVRLSADLIYKRGTMHFMRGLLFDRPVTFRGTDTRTKSETFGIAPTLDIELGGAWSARVSGFYGTDRTHVMPTSYSNGVQGPALPRRYANRNLSVDAGLQGPLIALAAGDVRLAMGGGMRSNRLSVDLAGDTFTPSRENYFAYGEMFVPLASPHQDIGLVHRASFTAALRWEDYSDSGSIVTPKLGLVYAPAEALSLGLTWGRSFKLPTLFQQYNGYAAVLLPASDYGSRFPAGSSYLYLLGANADVGPERSENWTLSATIRPSSRLQFNASFYTIDYKDRVAPPLLSYVGALTNPLYTDLVTFNPVASLLNDAIAGAEGGLQNATPGAYDPAAVIALLDGRDRNIARQKYSGADLSLRYRAPIGDQTLTITAAGSWLDSRQRLRPDLPTTDLAGLIFNPPHFRARAGASYGDERFTLASFVSFSGGVTDRRRAVPVKLQPFTTVDVTAQVRLSELADVSLAALNIFNKKPEVLRTTSSAEAPYDTTNYSPVGRFLGVTVRRDW